MFTVEDYLGDSRVRRIPRGGLSLYFGVGTCRISYTDRVVGYWRPGMKVGTWRVIVESREGKNFHLGPPFTDSALRSLTWG